MLRGARMSFITKTVSRRHVLHAGLAAGAALLLPTTPARACEFFCLSLRITHPWTRASATGATTAQVLMRFDEVTADDRLIRIETPVAAGAELVGDGPARPMNLLIAAGQELTLTETGLHIRLTGLRQPLEMACTYPLTLTFEKSGVVEADLSVDYV